ncbi:hypothetical protein DFH27DRAFT_545632, partial [Peziza echinospora]
MRPRNSLSLSHIRYLLFSTVFLFPSMDHGSLGKYIYPFFPFFFLLSFFFFLFDIIHISGSFISKIYIISYHYHIS